MACRIVNFAFNVRWSTSEYTRRLLFLVRNRYSQVRTSRDPTSTSCLNRVRQGNTADVTHMIGALSTWTDKLRRRWQSGSNSYEQGNKEKPRSPVLKEESSASNKLPSQSGEEFLPDNKTKQHRSLRELEMMLEMKEKELEEQAKATKEYKDRFLRALAETENIRQRMQKQIDEAKSFGIQEFAKDILEVADVLEKATETVTKQEVEETTNSPISSLHRGLKLTETQLQKVLIKNGLTKIDAVGDVFDPTIHEALFEVPGKKSGTVAVVYQVGYLLNGRTIRAAKVGVVQSS